MARPDQSVHPIETLRDTTRWLEAAILVCLAKPGKKAVHNLRTATRRVEAQLELLAMLPGLPPHKPQRQQALRLLKNLRHAAGAVRDLDVQRDLIRAEAARGSRRLRDEARQLRRALRRKRDDHADQLIELLHKQSAHLPLAFEELLDKLAPAESLALSEPKLTGLVHTWYEHPAGPRSHPAESDDDTANLHAVRKRAKLARYLAESAPASAIAAHRLAARFEKLQEAGGEWHDWLILSQVAATELGDSSALSARFAAHTHNSLRTFRRRLGRPI